MPHDPSWRERLSPQQLKDFAGKLGEQPVVGRVRQWMGQIAREVRTVTRDAPSVGVMAERLARRVLNQPHAKDRSVINATGVLLPSGLDMPLADAACEQLAAALRESSPAEYGVDGVSTALSQAVAELTGAPAALVLGNQSSALVLTVAALANGSTVVMSRAELGEVAALSLADAVSFAGATLVEVGAARRTSTDDFAGALKSEHSIILRHMASSYRLVGDVQQPSLAELAAVGNFHRTPVVVCVELATLEELPAPLAAAVPVVSNLLSRGADLVIFSGDGLVGGPACGLVVGSQSLIKKISQHPLCRLASADRTSLAALEATLRLYADGKSARQSLPLWQTIGVAAENLLHRAGRLAPRLERSIAVEKAEVVASTAFLTPARFADQQLPSWSIALRPAQGTAEKLAEQLRAASPAVWTTVDGGRVRLDLRTVLPRQDEPLVAALEALGLKPTAAPAASAGGASTSVETAQPTTGASEAASTGASPGSASTPESPSSG